MWRLEDTFIAFTSESLMSHLSSLGKPGGFFGGQINEGWMMGPLSRVSWGLMVWNATGNDFICFTATPPIGWLDFFLGAKKNTGK